MRLFTKTCDMSTENYSDILNYFFKQCDKVNIYFPNEASNDLVALKKDFLSTTHIYEGDDELSHLEPKEGFTMVIASLSQEVQVLLQKLKSFSNLSFGLIEDTDVVFYISEDGECVIEAEDLEPILADPLFATFKQI